ncbi:type II toxin-antitoxin system Phd/YefM family antitoxin [Pseudomonas jinjuensis]|uniref:Antitoxin n=1 Tax=Pseudomonas jinjuensis TaxID=198616 RepID=A0A1H0AUR9_9PSED|nr:type II toxin-antitoxin system prevent-host-death family antitoxin [Pseudomonas jinjuensis]SDN37182.1 prevent-host-death family protein [Pseudomonas jinjuensis]
MQIVNIHEAKTHLSKLVELAAAGEPFIIAKAGKPLVVVTAIEDKPRKRFGMLEGLYPPVPDDFDSMFAADIEAMFYGEDDQ